MAAFTRIESRGALGVEVTQNDTPSLQVSIDSNLIGDVQTRVAGNTLIIDESENMHDLVSGPHVIVAVPTVEQASLSGSGDIELRSFKQDSPVLLFLDGSGNLAFGGQVPALTAHSSGSGDVWLDGSADSVQLDLDGSGNIQADSFTALAGRLSLDGSGDIAARVDGPTRVALSGSGSVDVYGTPELEVASNSGSGDIRVH